MKLIILLKFIKIFYNYFKIYFEYLAAASLLAICQVLLIFRYILKSVYTQRNLHTPKVGLDAARLKCNACFH